MGLSIASIQKIMRESFTGSTPWRIAPDERESVQQQIKERLSRLKNIKVDHNPYYDRSSSKNKKDVLCTFFIDDPGDGWRSYQNFGLFLNDRQELRLGHAYVEDKAVSSIAEIESFIAACQAQLDRQVTLASRRQKIRDFKAQAIIAQVKQIATEDQFEFFTENDTVKLKLSIRLTKIQSLQINIPFNRFQEVLPKLRSIIASVRLVYEQGVYFKIKSISSWDERRFIKPDVNPGSH